MSILGVHLTLLIGPTVPTPAPMLLMEALQSVQVNQSDEGQSGFQISFQAGRGGPLGVVDYPLLSSPLLKCFNRVILLVTINVRPFVLFDGLITQQQVNVSSTPGASTLTITGEDVSYAMDREEKSAEHPAQSDAVIARKIIASYPQYGLLPNVIDPPSARVPSLVDHVPTQQQTDLGHLRMMAERHGYVFYVTPGEAPGMNVAYWGPPQRSGVVQRAITANMGSASNVESVNFHYDALASTLYAGEIKDARAGHASIRTYVSSRIPQLAILPAILFDRAGIRTNQYRVSGPDIADAQARAQALTDASTDRVLTATGELDAARYGDLLRPRALVGLRGAGFSFDGVYYVKSVSHTLMRGAYKQQFTLTREGKGSTVSTVRQ